MSDDNEEYQVGYKKPPIATRFKKGQSGNPRGRRPRPKSFATLVERELDKMVTGRTGKGLVRMSNREALVKTIFSGALKGNPRCIDYVLKMDSQIDAPAPFEVSPQDEDLLALLKEENGFKPGASKDKPDGED